MHDNVKGYNSLIYLIYKAILIETSSCELLFLSELITMHSIELLSFTYIFKFEMMERNLAWKNTYQWRIQKYRGTPLFILQYAFFHRPIFIPLPALQQYIVCIVKYLCVFISLPCVFLSDVVYFV